MANITTQGTNVQIGIKWIFFLMIPQVDTIYIWERYGVDNLTSENRCGKTKIGIAQDKNTKKNSSYPLQGASSIQFDIIEKMDLVLMSNAAYETSHGIKGIAH